MTGGSTIVEFWRDEPIATETQAQSDDILLLKQAVLDIDETAADDRPTELWVKRLGIALLVVALGWIGFAIWSMAASGAWRGGPGAWADAIATIAVPLILLGLLYMLLVRSSRTESRRYMETARALRTEADLLELRLGRIAAQLESARQTMQDQAELLDSYGAAASSNMEASAELIASRAQVTADRAEAAERAGAALIARMDALVASIPALEERSARMAAQIMDNGHALGERIDTLEARLHALTEMSDEARARTLAATKSLTSQLSQLQEATRATTDEVSGMADIAANRIEATAAGARQMMDRSRSDLEAQSSALAALIDAAQAGVASSSESVRAALVRDLDSAQADMDSRLDGLLHKARETVASIDDSLTRRADSLQALVAAAQAGIGSSSGDALATLSRDMDQIENDLRARLGAALDQAQEALALSDGRLSRQAEALTALITRSREHLDAIGSDTVAGLTDVLCGAYRPGHFDGVATVVTKLFRQTAADFAFFGEKDFQQLQVVRRLSRDLDLGVEVVGCPTIREIDGLAMSSRNLLLSDRARVKAPRLHEVMEEIAAGLAAGRPMPELVPPALLALEKADFLKVDYLELRSCNTLALLESPREPARLFAAAYLAGVRLIDNIDIPVRG